jgi:hypothetical protein
MRTGAGNDVYGKPQQCGFLFGWTLLGASDARGTASEAL